MKVEGEKEDPCCSGNGPIATRAKIERARKRANGVMLKGSLYKSVGLTNGL